MLSLITGQQDGIWPIFQGIFSVSHVLPDPLSFPFLSGNNDLGKRWKYMENKGDTNRSFAHHIIKIAVIQIKSNWFQILLYSAKSHVSSVLEGGGRVTTIAPGTSVTLQAPTD